MGTSIEWKIGIVRFGKEHTTYAEYSPYELIFFITVMDGIAYLTAGSSNLDKIETFDYKEILNEISKNSDIKEVRWDRIRNNGSKHEVRFNLDRWRKKCQ